MSGKRDVGLIEHAKYVVANEFGELNLRLELARIAALLFPRMGAGRERSEELRLALLRRLGFSIGDGTVFADIPEFQTVGQDVGPMLAIGSRCSIASQVTFDLGERIVLGDDVTVGHQVLLVTTSHELGPRTHRAGLRTRAPITIEDGAWLGPRVVVLPGIRIGSGAVVQPGTLVTKDVPPDTRVGGVPAKGAEKLAP